MTRRESFLKKRKIKNEHCSGMSSLARCDLKSKNDILKLHDMCPKAKYKCQKQNKFTP